MNCSKCNIKDTLLPKRTICRKCYNLQKKIQQYKRSLIKKEGICSKCNQQCIYYKGRICKKCKNQYEKERRINLKISKSKKETTKDIQKETTKDIQKETTNIQNKTTNIQNKTTNIQNKTTNDIQKETTNNQNVNIIIKNMLLKTCVQCKLSKQIDCFIRNHNGGTECKRCNNCLKKNSINKKKAYKQKKSEQKKSEQSSKINVSVQKYIEINGLNKKCTTCGCSKKIRQFISKINFKILKTCDKCRNKGLRSRNKHKEVINKRQQKWRKENKERISQYNKCYRENKNWDVFKIENKTKI